MLTEVLDKKDRLWTERYLKVLQMYIDVWKHTPLHQVHGGTEVMPSWAYECSFCWGCKSSSYCYSNLFDIQAVSEDKSVKIIITFTRKSTGPHARRSRIPLCLFFCKIPYLISYLVENSTLKKPNLLH